MYTVDYFINKFQAIPEEKWITGVFSSKGKHCALGHCLTEPSKNTLQYSRSQEYVDLQELLSKRATYINDKPTVQFPHDTPKKRILAALLDIKSREPVELSDPPVTIEDILSEELVTM